MTTINTADDFLKALDDNPALREAVRVRILDAELLQLPVKLDAFIAEQRQIVERFDQSIERFDAFIAEQRQANARFDAFIVEQRQANERFDAAIVDHGQIIARLDRSIECFDAFIAEQRRANARFDASISEHSQMIARLDRSIERFDAFIAEQRQANAEQRQANAEQRRINERFDTFIAEQRQANADQRQANAEQHRANEEQRQANEEQRQTNERFDAFIAEQRQVIERFDASIAEMRRMNDNAEARMNRMESDMGAVKGGHVRSRLKDFVPDFVEEMNCELTQVIDRKEVILLSRQIPNATSNERRSFRRADMVVLAGDSTANGEPVYLAVEASYTGSRNDTHRAQRNARFLTEVTGVRAIPVIASVRNTHEVTGLIESGLVRWYEIEERDIQSD